MAVKPYLAQLNNLNVPRSDNVRPRLFTLYNLNLGSKEVLDHPIRFRLIEILPIS
jgi:hypothetical protein